MSPEDIGRDLTRYEDWAPTGFDPKGLGTHPGGALEGKGDWRVLPLVQTRDSDCLAESNFESAQRILDDAGVDYEVHRFGHWGPGWFEIIVVPPEPAALKAAGEIASAMDDYPVLNEQDLSEREMDAAWEAWEAFGRKDFIRQLAAQFDLAAETVEFLESYVDSSWLMYFHDEHNPDSFTAHLDHGGGVDASYIERGELAAFLREQKRRLESEGPE